MIEKFLRLFGLAVMGTVLSGCAVKPYDYTAFKGSNPRSILVLPPTNDSPDVRASESVYAQVTKPVAESGYYVFPVAVVSETFKSNGLIEPSDIQAVSLAKLNEVFGPDAVLYLSVREYGTKYQVILSDSRVTVDGRLLDAKTGQLLWQGSATASSSEQSGANGNIFALLIQAAVNQIVNTATNRSHIVAPLTTHRLLSAD
ncbi:DUF799 domain-containing protein, partial [Streptomyces albidoflavus]